MIDFDNFSTFGNSNDCSTKHVQTVSLQPDYVSNLPKNNTELADAYAVHFVELIVPDFCRKSSSLSYLLENSFSSLLAENLLHSHGF